MWVEDNCRETIDFIYDAFVEGLPEEYRASARDLPHLLDLHDEVPSGTSWGRACDNVIQLGLPMFVLLESDHYVSEDLCIAALRAHLFGQIAAMIHDRFARLDLYPRADLCAILLLLERERDQIVAELCSLGGRARLDCSVAQREAREGVHKEQEFVAGDFADIGDFVAVNAAKASPTFPALLAGASAAGYGLHELGHLHELIVGLALGIAARDEICNWLERAQLGRSWLAAVRASGRSLDESITAMLDLAAASFNHAVRAAHSLGAATLADWTRNQAEQIEVLLQRSGQLSGPRLARVLRTQLEVDAQRFSERRAA